MCFLRESEGRTLNLAKLNHPGSTYIPPGITPIKAAGPPPPSPKQLLHYNCTLVLRGHKLKDVKQTFCPENTMNLGPIRKCRKTHTNAPTSGHCPPPLHLYGKPCLILV